MRNVFRSLLAILLLSPGCANKNPDGDYVAMLHGTVRTSLSMRPFAKYLEKQGYNVININYPSTRYTIEELAEKVHQEIESKRIDKSKKVHFVAYSMGSLITRYILANKQIENVGRVVFVAPPSQGSEIADFLKDNFLYKKVYGVSGQQLVTDGQGFANTLPPINYEIGIIAGDSPVNPMFMSVFPGPNDGTVAVERTKIEGMKDHIVIHASHTFIINNKEAMAQAACFLQNGKFNR